MVLSKATRNLMSYWKKESTETIFKHPRLHAVEDKVILPNGKQTKYMRHEDVLSYVTVIAREENKIAFVREYSYPNNEFLIQFPEGSVEEGEDLVEAAKRELEEEAGLKADKLTQIGWNLDNHRRNDAKQYVLIAEGITEGPRARGDDEEYGIETVWYEIGEVNRMILNQQIVQKNALAAWSLFSLHL